LGCRQINRRRNGDLAAQDPGAYRPDVAGALNSLGILYRHTGHRADAEKAFSEALTIYRDLTHDPRAYRPNVAMTLNNLGNLYSDTGRRADAEKAFSEALTIYRDLAAHDPGAHRPDVAMTLNNLGDLYSDTGRRADAEKAYSEALAIFRDLAATNPAYASKIAGLTKLLSELRGNSSSSPHPKRAPPSVPSLHKSWMLLKNSVAQPQLAILESRPPICGLFIA
jgi:tetratricopeptide (TPR) repeat protein